MDEHLTEEENSNPLMKRLYSKAKDSRLIRIFLLIMIIDEPIMALVLMYMAFF